MYKFTKIFKYLNKKIFFFMEIDPNNSLLSKYTEICSAQNIIKNEEPDIIIDSNFKIDHRIALFSFISLTIVGLFISICLEQSFRMIGMLFSLIAIFISFNLKIENFSGFYELNENSKKKLFSYLETHEFIKCFTVINYFSILIFFIKYFNEQFLDKRK
ncbi:hypothetical protein CWI36_0023p0050 [Hamiltosporidium magnivora]|uniref:Uncharacterized protein n=1 Tax=Hamiltosporidium magnivora TaxID=148818 RepID=A0A4Q9LQ65_9MICR|nr:hypothetical protein CWI36_0023p0050 [Hamiltosporidium magnivora]